MGKESLQHKIDGVRAPRVHITYDVEIGGANEAKEIPFVVGVLADLSGKPGAPLPKLKERKFVEIDRDNFDSVLAGMKPRLAFQVDNRLAGDGSKLPVELRFEALDDFRPEQVARQIEPLRRLVEMRRRLSELLNRLDGNDRLEELLREAISGNNRKRLAEQTGVAPADNPSSGK